MKGVLLFLTIALLVGCDGPVFRRSSSPSSKALAAQLGGLIPTYLEIRDVRIQGQNNKDAIQHLQFELKVTSSVDLYSPRGANLPGWEEFQLRPTYKAGQEVRLSGTVVAQGMASEWAFRELQWQIDPSEAVGRPKDGWPGSYVLEGSPEAAERIKQKLKILELVAETNRKIREADSSPGQRSQQDSLVNSQPSTDGRPESPNGLLAKADQMERSLNQRDADEEYAIGIALSRGFSLARGEFAILRGERKHGEPLLDLHLLVETKATIPTKLYRLLAVNRGSSSVSLKEVRRGNVVSADRHNEEGLQRSLPSGACISLSYGPNPVAGETVDLYADGYGQPVKYFVVKR